MNTMKNLILTISIVVSVIFGSFAQSNSSDSVTVFDANMGREYVVELPDTIFCVYGRREENDYYSYISFDNYYGENHYFIFEPYAKDVFIAASISDDNYFKRVVFDDNLYIIDTSFNKNVNIVYVSDEGGRISKEDHEYREKAFEEQMKWAETCLKAAEEKKKKLAEEKSKK